MREFVAPVINKFGFGCLNEIAGLAAQAGGTKALIVTDENLMACGVVDTVLAVLEAAHLPYEIYSGVRPNPDKQNVYEALEVLKDAGCDYIIGVGGGSPNDCCKAVGILAANGGKIEDYLGLNASPMPSVPIIAVNTTAGTASEISRAYIISDTEKQEKLIAKDIHALPFASINDSALMLKLPAAVTAATGMDALTHAVESYVSNGAWLLTRKLAAVSVRLVFDNLAAVMADPENIELRDAMIVAATTGGMAFCNAGVGIGHSLAHALGAMYDLPHGLCTAVVLPGVIRFNSSVAAADYAALAREVFVLETQGMDDAACVDYFVDRLEQLLSDVRLDGHLSTYGVKASDLPTLADKALRDGNTGRNPVKPTIEDLIGILESIL